MAQVRDEGFMVNNTEVENGNITEQTSLKPYGDSGENTLVAYFSVRMGKNQRVKVHVPGATP